MFEYAIQILENQLDVLVKNTMLAELGYGDIATDNMKSELTKAIQVLKEYEDKEKELFSVKALNKCLSDKLAEFRNKYGCEYQLSNPDRKE